MKPSDRPEIVEFEPVDPNVRALLQAACGLAFDHGRLQEEHRQLRQRLVDHNARMDALVDAVFP